MLGPLSFRNQKEAGFLEVSFFKAVQTFVPLGKYKPYTELRTFREQLLSLLALYIYVR